MREFFNYQSPYRTNIFMELSLFERIIPLIGVTIIIFLLFKYRYVFRKNSELDKKVRYTLGFLLFGLFASHFILRFALYGLDTIVLPFHLSSIAMVFAIYLLFTNNKSVYAFVLLAGVLGGVISLTSPVFGYNASYYRYYQFFFAHIILLITPLYYLFVHQWLPSNIEVWTGYIILQVLAKFMLLFNYVMGTDFMFMFLDPSKIDKFPAIKYLGGIPFYLIVTEIVIGFYFYGSYKFFVYLDKKKEESITLEGGIL